jgi:Zn-dependent membrane protease YugP
MSYLLLILVTLAIGFGAQGYVRRQLSKYSHVPNSSNLTGRDVAVGMLNYYGVQGVEVRMGREGEDFFNPKDNSISLGPDSYNGRSITATATACHEVGHACQYAQGYTPMKVRSALVPAVNLASNAWVFILLAGIILNVVGLVDLAIILYAVAVLFQIVTLPVEFNASRRAMAYMQSTGIPGGEQAGAWNVLRACALTYVAAALVSILQLLYLLSARDN